MLPGKLEKFTVEIYNKVYLSRDLEFAVLNFLASSSVQDAVSPSEKFTTLSFRRVAGVLFLFILAILEAGRFPHFS